MDPINIQFTLFSAFYSPLIAAISGGFLNDEGLEAKWSISGPGVSAVEALKDGTADVVQSAPSQSFGPLSKGIDPGFVHFAKINSMDGFFLSGRAADPDFEWKQLEGSEVVLFGGGQPLAMFKFACQRAGIDFYKIRPIHVGGAADMDRAFRDGIGDYVQQQGPFPQQMEADGIGHIVARVGEMVGLCAFSSLAATREWLQTEKAAAFTRGYAKALTYMNQASAKDIARSQQSYFPEIAPDVLERCIASYQDLGNWAPGIEITRDALDATFHIYQATGGLDRPFAYEYVCAAPPGH